MMIVYAFFSVLASVYPVLKMVTPVSAPHTMLSLSRGGGVSSDDIFQQTSAR